MTLTVRRAEPVLERLEAHAPAIASLIDGRDEATARFPAAAWELLIRTGVGAATVAPVPAAQELALVRAVSAIDVGLGRIFDGHLNGVQRLALQVEDRSLAARELDAIGRGHLSVGVWGADPGPGEGEPARLIERPDGPVLVGTKTFCSGAGGLDRAFVLARRDPGERGPAWMTYVDLSHGVVTDPSWYRGSGMRSSASHRVDFQGARVLWVAPEPGALLRMPYFAGDAIRTAAGWVGGADIAVAELVAILHRKGAAGDLPALSVARARTAHRALGLWLREGAAALDDPGTGHGELETLAIQLRWAVADGVRAILDEAGRAVGSHPFATGGRLERTRRDLDTYLLQHRLEPMLARAGRRELDAG